MGSDPRPDDINPQAPPAGRAEAGTSSGERPGKRCRASGAPGELPVAPDAGGQRPPEGALKGVQPGKLLGPLPKPDEQHRWLRNKIRRTL
jgi:hypothetical protein